VVSLLIFNVKAYTLTSVDTPYYFTFKNDAGKNFSDRQLIYYVDGVITYCIEPGVPLGNDTNYSLGNISYLPSYVQSKIENYMYYGYMFKNHTDIKYYLATQLLIWNELLVNKGVIYSDQLFGKGNVIDLSYYVDEIEKTIKMYTDGPYKFSITEIYIGDEKTIPLDNDILEDFTFKNISGTYKYKIVNKNLLIYNVKHYGAFSLTQVEKDRYDQDYKVYISDNKQNLISLGNIYHSSKTLVFIFKGGSLKIHKKDKETDSLIGPCKYGLYDKNNKLLKEIQIDNNGYGQYLEYIPVGVSYLKEITAPIGYQLDDTKYYIEISKDNDIIDITLYDNKINGDVIINKLDVDTNKGISNTIINIYNINNELIDSLTTNKDGIINIKLPYGKYYFQEYEANEEYEYDDTVYELIIDKNTDYNITLYNKHKPIIDETISSTSDEDLLIIEDVPNTNSNTYIIYIFVTVGVLFVLKKVL
jgi:hypothetical protein